MCCIGASFRTPLICIGVCLKGCSGDVFTCIAGIGVFVYICLGASYRFEYFQLLTLVSTPAFPRFHIICLSTIPFCRLLFSGSPFHYLWVRIKGADFIFLCCKLWHPQLVKGGPLIIAIYINQRVHSNSFMLTPLSELQAHKLAARGLFGYCHSLSFIAKICTCTMHNLC